MALPRPVIQVLPPGLLSLLGLKNGGVNPTDFGNIVAPTLELSDWYLRGKQEHVAGVSATLAPAAWQGYLAASTQFTVPQGEWWYIRHYSGTLVTTATDTVSNACLGYSFQTIGNIGLSQNLTLPISTTGFLIEKDPFWVPPGATLGLISGTITGAAAVFQGRIVKTSVQV